MVRTGKRAEVLRAILESAGVRFQERAQSLRMADLGAPARAKVLRVHALLGGLSPDPILRPGSWDLVTSESVFVELDEEFHFTRYRAATLRLPTLGALPWTRTHLAHSAAFERAAIAGGQRWTSGPSEKMFGPSDPVGVFGERGSARGKQRALYDSMKDIAAATRAVHLARISIYDEVDGIPLTDILRGRRTVSADAVREAIEDRVSGAGRVPL